MEEDHLKNELDGLKAKVESLEKRINEIEKHFAPHMNMQDAEQAYGSAAQKLHGRDIILSEGSRLGWLGIIVSLFSFAFFVRYAFLQDWISGWGQPFALGAIGIGLFLAGDYLRSKSYLKFGQALTACGALVLFLFVYWPAGRLSMSPPLVSLIGSGLLGAGLIAWGCSRDSALWPLLGLCGSLILPVFIYKNGFADPEPVIYYFAVISVYIAATLKMDWHWLPIVGSFLGHLICIISLRSYKEIAAISPFKLEWIMTAFPALLIIWSGIAHLAGRRQPQRKELAAWIINTVLLYLYIFSFWSIFNNPYVLVMPLLAASALAFAEHYFSTPGSRFNLAYKAGLVLAAGIALTVLLPSPFDIISLCIFSVFLAFLGNREQAWDMKGLSGAVVIWCVIFLIAARLRFYDSGEVPFINFRFFSFMVAFLSFGLQGRMINSDASAGKFGPVLGQGLFSLGLLVLTIGTGGELVRLFPSSGGNSISEPALLGLTVLGSLFSFITAMLGLLMRLAYLRMVALGFFLTLMVKLVVFDVPGLGALYLFISLCIAGSILVATSILFKTVGRKISF